MDRDYRALLQAKVDQHVDRAAGPHACWPWTGTRKDKGYGQFQLNNRILLAHRASYACATGHDIMDQPKILVLHGCDNRPCCNPAHLRTGTMRENTADAMERGSWSPPPRHGKRINAVLTPEQALEIASNPKGLSRSQLSRRYAISDCTIGRIRSGRSWSSVTGIAPPQVQS